MVSGCEKRGQATLLPLVLLHPFDQHDFRRTTPSDRQEGPSKAAIDVHATAVSHVVALGEPPAAVRQPKRTNRPESPRSEEHTSELQSLAYLVCRLLLEKKKKSGPLLGVSP